MNSIGLVNLDVRDDLDAGREPLPRILDAVSRLAPGQGLIVRATFEPIPLIRLMNNRGFHAESRRLGAADWEVTFLPSFLPKEGGEAAPPGCASVEDPLATGGRENGREWESESPCGAMMEADWPQPVCRLDNRGLTPPEPMVRILETLEGLGEGEVLEAFNDREPVFLFPELAARGHQVRTEKRPDAVRLLIRRGNDA